jgi:hypothetical protein
MFHLSKHIYSLERKMLHSTHLPTAFEYYSALHLTRHYQKPFFVYQDISPSKKTEFGFPIQDKGVDIVDEYFQHIVQVKYYRKYSKIYYGKLATFLATPLLIGKKLDMTLVRTDNCLLHSEIKQIVTRGDLKDITLSENDFLRQMPKIYTPTR